MVIKYNRFFYEALLLVSSLLGAARLGWGAEDDTLSRRSLGGRPVSSVEDRLHETPMPVFSINVSTGDGTFLPRRFSPNLIPADTNEEEVGLFQLSALGIMGHEGIATKNGLCFYNPATGRPLPASDQDQAYFIKILQGVVETQTVPIEVRLNAVNSLANVALRGEHSENLSAMATAILLKIYEDDTIPPTIKELSQSWLADLATGSLIKDEDLTGSSPQFDARPQPSILLNWKGKLRDPMASKEDCHAAIDGLIRIISEPSTPAEIREEICTDWQSLALEYSLPEELCLNGIWGLGLLILREEVPLSIRLETVTYMQNILHQEPLPRAVRTDIVRKLAQIAVSSATPEDIRGRIERRWQETACTDGLSEEVRESIFMGISWVAMHSPPGEIRTANLQYLEVVASDQELPRRLRHEAINALGQVIFGTRSPEAGRQAITSLQTVLRHVLKKMDGKREVDLLGIDKLLTQAVSNEHRPVLDIQIAAFNTLKMFLFPDKDRNFDVEPPAISMKTLANLDTILASVVGEVWRQKIEPPSTPYTPAERQLIALVKRIMASEISVALFVIEDLYAIIENPYTPPVLRVDALTTLELVKKKFLGIRRAMGGMIGKGWSYVITDTDAPEEMRSEALARMKTILAEEESHPCAPGGMLSHSPSRNGIIDGFIRIATTASASPVARTIAFETLKRACLAPRREDFFEGRRPAHPESHGALLRNFLSNSPEVRGAEPLPDAPGDTSDTQEFCKVVDAFGYIFTSSRTPINIPQLQKVARNEDLPREERKSASSNLSQAVAGYLLVPLKLRTEILTDLKELAQISSLPAEIRQHVVNVLSNAMGVLGEVARTLEDRATLQLLHETLSDKKLPGIVRGYALEALCQTILLSRDATPMGSVDGSAEAEGGSPAESYSETLKILQQVAHEPFPEESRHTLIETFRVSLLNSSLPADTRTSLVATLVKTLQDSASPAAISQKILEIFRGIIEEKKNSIELRGTLIRTMRDISQDLSLSFIQIQSVEILERAIHSLFSTIINAKALAENRSLSLTILQEMTRTTTQNTTLRQNALKSLDQIMGKLATMAGPHALASQRVFLKNLQHMAEDTLLEEELRQKAREIIAAPLR